MPQRSDLPTRAHSTPNPSRRLVLGAGLATGAALAVGRLVLPSPALAQAEATGAQKRERPARLDLDLVEDFVRAAHVDLERTEKLLGERPFLVNATWEWGGGDFETALGGASHMGNAEIARFLLAHGARMDVFCAAMLGKIEIVRAFLADDPGVVHLPGPHGIPLLAHAKAGKQDAVIELLQAHGAG